MYMPGRLTGDFRERGQLAFRFADQRIGLDAALFQHGTHDALALAGKRDQEMQRMQGLVSVLLGDLLRLLDGFLGFLSQFVESECHLFSLSQKQAQKREGAATRPAFPYIADPKSVV